MGFAHGLLLWGALLAAIPVVIHLLNRRRFKVVEWAAMEWLLEARIRNRRRVRLENLLLLLLRALVLILLAILVSRPFLDQGVLSSAAALAGTEHVVVLDDSLSMSVRLGDRTPFVRAVDRLGEIVVDLRERSPSSRLTVLRASRPEAPELAAIPVASTAVDALLRRLEEEEPSQMRLHPARVLESILSRATEEEGGASRTVTVLTDLRRTDWLEEDDLPDAVTRIAEKEWPLHIHDLGAGEASNLGLVEVASEARRAIAGVPVRLRAEIANRGVEAVEGVRLSYSTGDASPPPVDIGRIAPGETVAVPIDVVFQDRGHQAVTVRIDEDRLPGDDARHLVLDVRDAVRILIVAGDPYALDGEGEADFLRAAFSPAGGRLSGVEVEITDENRFPSVDFADRDLVALVDLTSPPPEAVERLEEWVRDGGGLLVFLGERVDPEATNRTLAKEGRGLLPAVLADTVGDLERAEGVGFEPADPDHPLLRGFGGAGNPLQILLRRARVYRRFAVRPGEADDTVRPILNYAGSDEPALLEKTFGKGRVLLVTTSADRSWTSWPRNPTYLVLMQEILRYAGRAATTDLVLDVGSVLRRRLDSARTDGRVRFRTPGWPEEAETDHRAGADPDDEAGLVLDLGPARRAGIYELAVQLRNGETEPIRYAVNVHAAEGDLRRASPSAVEERLPGASVESGPVADLPGRAGGRVELAAVIALALGGLILLESIVAWLFGHHARRQAANGGAA